MINKIKSSLKTRYANLGVGDSVLDRVAESLSKTITSEEGIEAAVTSDEVKNLLVAVQSSSDRIRTELAELKKQLADKQSKDEPANRDNNGTPKDDTNAQLMEMMSAMSKELAEMKEYRLREEKTRRQTDMMSRLKETLKGAEYNCTNEAVLGLTLKGYEFGENDTIEGVAKAKKQEYDENFKNLFGDGYQPMGAGMQGKGSEFDAKAEIARLQAEGKLPKPNNGQ